MRTALVCIVHVCQSISVFLNTCQRTCTCSRVLTCMCVCCCMFPWLRHARRHRCVFICALTIHWVCRLVRMFISMCARLWIHMNARACVYICTHTCWTYIARAILKLVLINSEWIWAVDMYVKSEKKMHAFGWSCDVNWNIKKRSSAFPLHDTLVSETLPAK